MGLLTGGDDLLRNKKQTENVFGEIGGDGWLAKAFLSKKERGQKTFSSLLLENSNPRDVSFSSKFQETQFIEIKTAQ